MYFEEYGAFKGTMHSVAFRPFYTGGGDGSFIISSLRPCTPSSS